MILAIITKMLDAGSSRLRQVSSGPVAIPSLPTFRPDDRLGHFQVQPHGSLMVAAPSTPLSGASADVHQVQPLRPNLGHIVEIRILRLQDCKASDWDAFAQRCDASYQMAHDWLRGWATRSLLRKRVKLFEFYRSDAKIGQCAVGSGKHKHIFLDRLALIPGCEALWSECMSAVLRHLGAGRYRYGWTLSLDTARDDELRTLPGVAIESVRPLTVHAIDFTRWQSWDEYWASTSSNTRRNAKKGESAGLSISTRTEVGCLSHLGSIARLRSAMYNRKGIEFHPARVLTGYIAGHIFAPRYRLSAVAEEKGNPQAGFIGYEFGNHTYYLAGGSLVTSNGSAWYLQKAMLQRAWERTQGQAKFIMGYVDYATHDEAIGGGLLRSRRSVNVSMYDTSIVTFLYTG